MLRHEEMDFLDGMTLEQVSAALGVPIYPIAEDGGGLCDAMLGILPELRLPVRSAGDTPYNRYNPPPRPRADHPRKE